MMVLPFQNSMVYDTGLKTFLRIKYYCLLPQLSFIELYSILFVDLMLSTVTRTYGFNYVFTFRNDKMYIM